MSWTTDLRYNTYLLRAAGAGIPSTLFPRQHPVSIISQTDCWDQKDILRVYDSFVHTYPCPSSESFGWRLSITGGSKAEGHAGTYMRKFACGDFFSDCTRSWKVAVNSPQRSRWSKGSVLKIQASMWWSRLSKQSWWLAASWPRRTL